MLIKYWLNKVVHEKKSRKTITSLSSAAFWQKTTGKYFKKTLTLTTKSIECQDT